MRGYKGLHEFAFTQIYATQTISSSGKTVLARPFNYLCGVKNKIIEQVSIFDVADKGRGVGRHEGKAIFVEHAIPGDVADVEVFKKSKSFDEARVLKLITPSPFRTDPQCSHFGLCGGCKWQNMDYTAQLQFKEKTVRDAMERLAKISSPPILPIVGSEPVFHYRNKLEFTFTNLRYLLKEEMDQETPKQLNGLEIGRAHV